MYNEQAMLEKSAVCNQGAAYGAGLGVQSPEKESEIKRVSRQLDLAIERLERRSVALHEALALVLHQAPSSKSENTQAPMVATSSALGGGIVAVASKINSVSDKLELILNTLAL